VRQVADPPVEAIAALRSRWARSAIGEDGLIVRQIGCWLGVFLVDDDEDGDSYFVDSRFVRYGSDLAAVEAFEALVVEEVEL
jgi:hypothetical protein